MSSTTHDCKKPAYCRNCVSADRLALGRCRGCESPQVPGHTFCAYHLELHRQSSQRSRNAARAQQSQPQPQRASRPSASRPSASRPQQGYYPNYPSGGNASGYNANGASTSGSASSGQTLPSARSIMAQVDPHQAYYRQNSSQGSHTTSDPRAHHYGSQDLPWAQLLLS
ncbi:hypothetical protein M426DRAFT_19756 [Hypoxylon sp. CI-4A]|nr:hypothetical protein M426DRAFT_19756 [Hypoxylon sp. CI-4A]